MDTEIIQLIQQDVDGLNSPEGKSALREVLEKDPIARTEYEHLQQTADLVAHLDRVEPPRTLFPRVMDALPSQSKQPAASIAGWWTALLGLLQRKPAFGYAWALALGVFIGVAGIGLVQGALETDMVAGTMAPKDATLDHLTIEAPGTRGYLRLSEGSGVLSLEASIDAEHLVDLQITYADDELALTEIERMGSGARTIGADAGEIVLAVDGRAVYRLTFTRASDVVTPLNIHLLRNGEVQFRHVMPIQR